MIEPTQFNINSINSIEMDLLSQIREKLVSIKNKEIYKKAENFEKELKETHTFIKNIPELFDSQIDINIVQQSQNKNSKLEVIIKQKEVLSEKLDSIEREFRNLKHKAEENDFEITIELESSITEYTQKLKTAMISFKFENEIDTWYQNNVQNLENQKVETIQEVETYETTKSNISLEIEELI